MRTVTLELLRHGPAHNQLLSPLTPYLALCENHAPVTLTVPFEHNQFLHRLSALTYEFGTGDLAENQRRFQLQDTGHELSRLLCAVPGLTAELSRLSEESGSEMIHLRLVLSASELALLPFELVLAGNGFPGFGQPLLLQNQVPLCMTREVRRVPEPQGEWPQRSRVLFVHAQPPGMPPVPVQSHMLALRRAVDPWVRYFEEGNEDQRRERVSECLDVLPDASIATIQEACAWGQYSHVHILAHGLTRTEGFDQRFGLALHDEADPMAAPDIVSGERLAAALRPLSRPDRNGFVRPVVVTLASCNSAAGGSVVGAGASVAHALHGAGIALVVAGQFPLTFEGSVDMVQTLYEGLLWGEDPRRLLMDLRRRVYAAQPRSHDWAALTAYASLPSRSSGQHVIDRTRHALEVAMEHADQVLTMASKPETSNPTEDMMRRVRERIDLPMQAMLDLLNRMPERGFELQGLLASLCKRLAEVELAVSMLVPGSEAAMEKFSQAHRAECRALILRSRDHYLEAFRIRRDAAWAIVQHLCMSLLVGKSEEEANRVELWELAWALSIQDLATGDARADWALGNLMELPLLALLLGIKPRKDKGQRAWRDEALMRTDELLRRMEAGGVQVYSSRRQLERYQYWFGYANERFADLSPLAEEMLARFPAED